MHFEIDNGSNVMAIHRDFIDNLNIATNNIAEMENPQNFSLNKNGNKLGIIYTDSIVIFDLEAFSVLGV